MKAQLGSRLPTFTPDEIVLVQGSNDFYGMNSYTANYIKHKSTAAELNDFSGNLEVLAYAKNGECIGTETQSSWLRSNGAGFRALIKWIPDRYRRPKIYVTENGTSIKGENDLSEEDILKDEFRVEYYTGYIRTLADAVELDGCDVRGYMAWSLMDNSEWAEGYETRFGVTYVDYEGCQKRFPKRSARAVGTIFKELIKKE